MQNSLKGRSFIIAWNGLVCCGWYAERLYERCFEGSPYMSQAHYRIVLWPWKASTEILEQDEQRYDIRMGDDIAKFHRADLWDLSDIWQFWKHIKQPVAIGYTLKWTLVSFMIRNVWATGTIETADDEKASLIYRRPGSEHLIFKKDRTFFQEKPGNWHT